MNPSYSSDSDAANAQSTAYSAPQAPSVPLSVYRELATELQATKAMVDSLGTQNQYLSRQNQMLRQEIHQVVQAALQLGQYAGVAHPTETLTPPDAARAEAIAQPITAPNRAKRTARPIPAAAEEQGRPNLLAAVPKFFTEQTGEKQRFSALEASDRSPREMSSLWLVLSIVVIIMTAFGAGFLIMRPLLSDR